MPFARWYKEAAGYRKIGLKYRNPLRLTSPGQKPRSYLFADIPLCLDVTISFPKNAKSSSQPSSDYHQKKPMIGCTDYDELSR